MSYIGGGGEGAITGICFQHTIGPITIRGILWEIILHWHGHTAYIHVVITSLQEISSVEWRKLEIKEIKCFKGKQDNLKMTSANEVS